MASMGKPPGILGQASPGFARKGCSDAELRKRGKALAARLKLDRSPWDQDLREIGEQIAPTRVRFTTTDQNRPADQSKVVDPRAKLCRRTLEAGMVSGMTSPSRPWFKLGAGVDGLEKVQRVALWLSDTTNRMRRVMQRSNLYNALPTIFGDAATFGTAGCLALPDRESVVRFYPLTLGSFSLGVNHRGVVDRLARDVTFTATQLVERFGAQAVSPAVRAEVDKGEADPPHDVQHVLMPNPDYQAGKRHQRCKRYLSVWFELSGDESTVLEVGGYDHFPAVCPRWDVADGQTWGQGPGHLALASGKALQAYRKTAKKIIDKQADPPVKIPESLRGQPVSLLPGGSTYVPDRDADKSITAVYQVHHDISGVREEADEARKVIREAFFYDLFLMFAEDDRSGITATEVQARHAEKMLMLGPVLERLNDELLDPLIDLIFAYMVEAGLVSDPPEELAGKPLKVEYISVMAQAQKMNGLAALNSWVADTGNLAQSFPEAADKIDVDAVSDVRADMYGVPPEVVRGDDQVAAIRQSRQAAARRQQQQEQLAQVAQGANLLSKTPISGDSALASLLGTGAA